MDPMFFHSIFFYAMEVNRIRVWQPIFFKISSNVFSRRKKLIQVWNLQLEVQVADFSCNDISSMIQTFGEVQNSLNSLQKCKKTVFSSCFQIMGKSKQVGNHKSGKKKHIAKTWKTKRRTKDLDQIHADMIPGNAAKLLKQEVDYDVTGSAQHYCLHCA